MKLWKVVRIAAWACLAGVFAVFVVAPENTGLGFLFLLAFYPLIIFGSIAKRTKEEKIANRDAKKKKRILDSTPVAAELVGMQEKIRGSVMVGCLAGGPLGAVLGAHLGKGRATFLVRYASGRTDVETVIVESARFKTLYALCE